METLIYWVLITLAAIFVGMGKGGLPVIATLGVPSLSLIMSPITAAGLLLPVYIVSDIFALSAYRRDYNWPVLRIGLIGMTIGVIIGGLTATLVIEWVVTLLIGLMGFFFALDQLTKHRRGNKASGEKPNLKKGIFGVALLGLQVLLVIQADHHGKFLLYPWAYRNPSLLAHQLLLLAIVILLN